MFFGLESGLHRLCLSAVVMAVILIKPSLLIGHGAIGYRRRRLVALVSAAIPRIPRAYGYGGVGLGIRCAT